MSRYREEMQNWAGSEAHDRTELILASMGISMADTLHSALYVSTWEQIYREILKDNGHNKRDHC